MGVSGFDLMLPGSGAYDIKGSLFMATPYARLQASERLSFWTMMGMGQGSMSLSHGDARQSADIAMQLVAAGGRRTYCVPRLVKASPSR